MKRFAIALTALSLASGAASAATFGNERPGEPAQPTTAVETVDVRAGSVMTASELRRAGLDADAKLTVTNFPSSEWALAHPER
ncbi:hypothetical protein PAF17_08980 [Paracoccus sp. Z330]|uniref:Uncharacterized protein n=1 Tax=Paracoccus onchidii TaxID=3017813 RepID=A0ABT4ZG41_9RHOB|nr:hypothetical protein [Paracoccus onchidii]MDB6177645.1 hypothetical protein [Paracoccus onchidii]